jgi:hypothetical protein
MTPEQFAYWLQGYAELTPNTPPNTEQWKNIRERLATVFHKVTPPLSVPSILGQPNQIGGPWIPSKNVVGDFPEPPKTIC